MSRKRNCCQSINTIFLGKIINTKKRYSTESYQTINISAEYLYFIKAAENRT